MDGTFVFLQAPMLKPQCDGIWGQGLCDMVMKS